MLLSTPLTVTAHPQQKKVDSLSNLDTEKTEVYLVRVYKNEQVHLTGEVRGGWQCKNITE